MSIIEEKRSVAAIPKLGTEGALEGLLAKYSVVPEFGWRFSPNGLDGDSSISDDALTLVPGSSCLGSPLNSDVLPLLPWRDERRFIELRQIVETRTVDPVLMCRFACLADGETMALENILYREYDLVEWLCGSPIERLYATVGNGRSSNVVARLASGIVCSIEAATTLPRGMALQDRHELIARRGVASDRVVDTQVAQNSIYTFTAAGTTEYTDTDNELFGLNAQEISLVRSAFSALSTKPLDLAAAHEQHLHLQELVLLTWESDRRGQRMSVEGAN